MNDKSDTQQNDDLDDEAVAFLSLARSSIAQLDSSPREVSEFAKLAFEFRAVEVVEFVDTSTLAGVRSSGPSTALRAERGETTIVWMMESGRLSGVVHSVAELHVSMQTPNQSADVDIEVGEGGSFEATAPSGPYRLVIAEGDVSWATPWTS